MYMPGEEWIVRSFVLFAGRMDSAHSQRSYNGSRSRINV